MSETFQRSSLLPEGFTMPVIPTLSIDTCRALPVSHCGTISLPFSSEPDAKAVNVIDQIQRFCNAVVEGIRNVLQSISNWFNSPQVRNFFKRLATAARRAGIAQIGKVPVRRRAVSTKRALIYRRKALSMQCGDH